MGNLPHDRRMNLLELSRLVNPPNPRHRITCDLSCQSNRRPDTLECPDKQGSRASAATETILRIAEDITCPTTRNQYRRCPDSSNHSARASHRASRLGWRLNRRRLHARRLLLGRRHTEADGLAPRPATYDRVAPGHTSNPRPSPTAVPK